MLRSMGVLGSLLWFGGCGGSLSPAREIVRIADLPVSGQTTVGRRIELPADTDVEIRLRLDGIDVRAELVVDDGARVLRADAPNDRLAVITFVLPAAPARAVELRVVGEDHADNRGGVAVTALALPRASAADRKRIEAVRLEAEACASYADIERGATTAAAFGRAAALRREIGDEAGEGRDLLQEAGTRYQRLDEWERSARLADEAVSRLKTGGEPALEVRAIRLHGAALHALANTQTGKARRDTYAAARESLTKAADLATGREMPFEAAYAVSYRGVTQQYQGRPRDAQADYERALELFRSARHTPGLSMSLGSLALLHHEQGEFRAAVARFDEALALSSPTESPAIHAYTLQNSALPLRVLGRFDAAIARYQQAAELLRGIGDEVGQAHAVHGIALALRYAGEPERARVLLEESIRKQAARHSNRELFAALVALADIEREAGRYTEAQTLLARAWPLASRVNEQARTLIGLGEVEQALGETGAARRHLEQALALELEQSHRYRGQAWLAVADLEAAAGNRHKAAAAFTNALGVAERSGSELDQTKALAGRAELNLSQGQAAAALGDTRRAIELLEAVGAAGTQAQQRAVFLGTQRRVFELQIAAQLELAREAARGGRAGEAAQARMEALATSERSRMGGLLEALGGPEGAASVEFLEHRARLYELLAGKRVRREALLETATPDAAAVAVLSRDIELLRAELVTVDAQVARRAGVAARPTMEWNAAQLISIVPATDLVAEYFLGESRSWVFLVRAGSVTVQELPPGEEVAVAARALIERWRTPGGATSAHRSVVLQRSFPGPVAAAAPTHRVWLIPDGALHALPLASLAGETAADSWFRNVELVVVPSLKAVALAGARAQSTTNAIDAPLLAVIADPIFERDDPRISGAQRQRVAYAPAAGADVIRTRSARELDSLQRLPATAEEARGIGALVPAQRTLMLTGAFATRESVLGADLRPVRYLHFATHAYSDPLDPELSALVLSRFSGDGTAREGILRLHDLAGVKLDADLVVLSGCETALGREIRGEGLVGLSYGFLQAGARTVVASLWRVPDTATAVLMREFYRQVLSEQASAAVALQRAQEHVRSHPRWAEPYYWAGFQAVTVDPVSAARTTTKMGEST
jgi:CHAT domain-containing protein/tetratricopeptide (TPR) repeat protein